MKFLAAGFKGRYDTLDIGKEFDYTYHDLSEVNDRYEAILCLDVIEHLPLPQGLDLLEKLKNLLVPGGILIVQTPNARCIRHPLSTDMTHCQVYNPGDLWSFLTCLGMKVEGFRVVFGRRSWLPWRLLFDLATCFLIVKVLNCDFADNLLVIGVNEGGESTK